MSARGKAGLGKILQKSAEHILLGEAFGRRGGPRSLPASTPSFSQASHTLPFAAWLIEGQLVRSWCFSMSLLSLPEKQTESNDFFGQ